MMIMFEGFSNSEQLNCEFKNIIYFKFDTLYSCTVTKLKNEDNNKIITVTNGTHTLNKNDNDVKGIWLNGAGIEYFPSGLGLLFHLTAFVVQNTQMVSLSSENFIGMKNLEYLGFYDTKLSFVPSNAFSKLTKLKMITLSQNQIEELPFNVFANNLNLESIRLNGNKIKFLGSGIFDVLTKLNYVGLRDNLCLSKDYNGTAEIMQLKNDIEINCKIQNEFLLTTLTQHPIEIKRTEFNLIKKDILNAKDQQKTNEIEMSKIVKERDNLKEDVVKLTVSQQKQQTQIDTALKENVLLRDNLLVLKEKLTKFLNQHLNEMNEI